MTLLSRQGGIMKCFMDNKQKGELAVGHALHALLIASYFLKRARVSDEEIAQTMIDGMGDRSIGIATEIRAKLIAHV